MKKSIALILTIFTIINAAYGENNTNGFYFDMKSFSHNNVKNYPIKEVDDFDRGHFKHVCELHCLNDTKKYEWSVERKLLNHKNNQPLSLEDSLRHPGYSDEVVKIFVLSSRGFLPGEEIDFAIGSTDGTEKKMVTFIPNTLIRKSRVDSARIEGKLVSINPTMYLISLKDFGENENLKMTSISNGEKIESHLDYSKTNVILHSPEVVGFNGGLNRVIIERSVGEKMTLTFPWGNELKSYLSGEKPPI